MNFVDSFMVKWDRLCKKTEPARSRIRVWFQRVTGKISYAWNYVSRFRKLFLAAPVATIAVVLAIQNMIKLPVLVGFDLQPNGEFGFEILRIIAVLIPLLITAICLLLVFISKRTLTPWLVSVFSLALPLLILVTNTFYQ
ncbi:MAG: hypothetical protein E7462_06330 [Ruminococcaceae bacterium]|nr:hypothetical protein [Oscillospiraceae bacterium]